jgi:hypothetical protein
MTSAHRIAASCSFAVNDEIGVLAGSKSGRVVFHRTIVSVGELHVRYSIGYGTMLDNLDGLFELGYN